MKYIDSKVKGTSREEALIRFGEYVNIHISGILSGLL